MTVVRTQIDLPAAGYLGRGQSPLLDRAAAIGQRWLRGLGIARSLAS